MESSSKPRTRTTSLAHPPTSQSTVGGRDTPNLRPRSSTASVQSRGYDSPHLHFQMHPLMLYSAVLMLEILTFSPLFHEGITYCINKHHIGWKRRLQVRRDQTQLLVGIVDYRDARVSPILLPSTPTNNGVRHDIRLNIQVLHGAGYGG